MPYLPEMVQTSRLRVLPSGLQPKLAVHNEWVGLASLDGGACAGLGRVPAFYLGVTTEEVRGAGLSWQRTKAANEESVFALAELPEAWGKLGDWIAPNTELTSESQATWNRVKNLPGYLEGN